MARLSAQLRPDILRIETSTGLDLVDLIRERITTLDEDEARALGLDPADDLDAELLRDRLDEAELLEGHDAEALRQSAWAGRKVRRVRPSDGLPHPVVGDWSLATHLPDAFSPTWRTPERWRRLAEDHAAGQRYLLLPDLLTHAAAMAIRDEVLALSPTRLSTDLVQADRHLLGPDDVPTWLDLLQGPTLRSLIAAVLAREIPSGLVVNAWRLLRGDTMGVHPDGRFYAATMSLGLCEDWAASMGGAIAFGVPRPTGLEVRQRWLPHLGDACLFSPDGATWHAVEPVTTDRPRHSLTGWWVEPEHGLTRGRS
jgi:hypothetical protein